MFYKGNLSPEELYWVGFIATDGYIPFTREGVPKGVDIELSLKDKDHLQKYLDFSGSKAKIIETRKQCCRIRTGNRKAAKNLVELGLVRNKTFNFKPDDELVNSKDFWRGVLDGDGCYIYSNKRGWKEPKITLTSAIEEFTLLFKEHMAKADAHYNIRFDKTSNVFKATVSSKRNVINTINYLYYNGCTCLTRKLNKILYIMSELTDKEG